MGRWVGKSVARLRGNITRFYSGYGHDDYVNGIRARVYEWSLSLTQFGVKWDQEARELLCACQEVKKGKR